MYKNRKFKLSYKLDKRDGLLLGGKKMKKNIIKPSILPGFMELLPREQKLFNDIQRKITKVYEENGKKVGYLGITIFASNTYEQFKEKLEELEKEGFDSLLNRSMYRAEFGTK